MRPSSSSIARRKLFSDDDVIDLYQSLSYEGIDDRQERLRDPSPKTMNWIFKEPGPSFT